ncbi:MAG: ABC transporter permease [Lachnospiraceae bacterium]|nr:ABC transporter permease [Lachnospiraceae bacterium]
MTYFKLSIRNAKRSFADYLLYIVTMTALSAVMEVSNCITITGKSAGFQAVSFPLLITMIQVVLAGYNNTFMLKQRAKEFANYLLLGMKRKELTNLFLYEILLLGLFCFLAGTAIGFVLYGLLGFTLFFHSFHISGSLYAESLLHTFFYFSMIEVVSALSLKYRLDKLQIRDLMHEKNYNQTVKNKNNYKNWGIVFCISFVCLAGIVCGIVFLPEKDIMPLVSTVAIPLLLSISAFYEWCLGFLYARRKKQAVTLYQKDRLYLTAAMTSNIRTAAVTNTVFCMCFLFSAAAFETGMLMLQPEIRLFAIDRQQWMGTLQIGIYIVFTVIYFSILSLHQIIELRQNTQNIRILHYIGKSSRQIKMLVIQQIVVKLLFPMTMASLLFSFCIPLLNRKMNLVLPLSMRNVLFKFTGAFWLCTFFFCLCYFFVIWIMGRQIIKLPHSPKHPS